MTPVTAELTPEITVTLTGMYHPLTTQTRSDPPDGDFTEDIAIEALTIDVWVGLDSEGRKRSASVDLLKGVDTSAPAIQAFLSNLLSAIEPDAQEALRDAGSE